MDSFLFLRILSFTLLNAFFRVVTTYPFFAFKKHSVPITKHIQYAYFKTPTKMSKT